MKRSNQVQQNEIWKQREREGVGEIEREEKGDSGLEKERVRNSDKSDWDRERKRE